MRKVDGAMAGVCMFGECEAPVFNIEIVKLRFEMRSLVLTMLRTWHKNSLSPTKESS